MEMLYGTTAEFITSEHMKLWKKTYNYMLEAVKTTKSRIFLEFFGKGYDKYLDFHFDKIKEFSAIVTSNKVNISNYEEMLKNVFHPLLVSQIQQGVASIQILLQKISNDINENHILKNKFGDDLKYILSKSISDYFDIEIYIWCISYEIDMKTPGFLKDISITRNTKYKINDFLKSFFTIAKDGNYYLDDFLLEQKEIDEKQFNERFYHKYMKYRKIIYENSIYGEVDIENEDRFPNALILGISKSPNFNFISNDVSLNIWKNLNLDNDTNIFRTIDFHILGLEPISIDAYSIFEKFNQ